MYLMNTGGTDFFEATHLAQWMSTTHHYLFADKPCAANAQKGVLPEPALISHGAQDHFLSRARGNLMRLVKRTARRHQSPLQELEQAFHSQASFIAQHPDIPKRLLGWLSQNGDSRIRRRIQKVIDQYEARLCRMIGQAKTQGLIRDNIEPRTAASIFIGMIQSLALRMNADLCQRELMLCEAFEGFALYLEGMASKSS
jgi:TetR/AcrR family transcriptional regulator